MLSWYGQLWSKTMNENGGGGGEKKIWINWNLLSGWCIKDLEIPVNYQNADYYL